MCNKRRTSEAVHPRLCNITNFEKTSTSGANFLYLNGDEGRTIASLYNNQNSGPWASSYAFFSNLRANIRVYAIRVYNRVLSAEERERNYLLDWGRFQNKTIKFISEYTADLENTSTVLPAEYQSIDCVIANGAQQIDTNFDAGTDISVMADFMPSGGTRHITLRDYTASLTYIDGVRQANTTTPVPVEGTKISFLKTGDVATGAGRLYGAAVWKEGELVAYYKPCYQVADNVAGLFDLVSKQFYPSATTTPFAFIPKGYVRLPTFSGGSVTQGIAPQPAYANLTNLTFSVWVRNPRIGTLTTDHGANGVILSQGALGGAWPGFACFVSRLDGGVYVQVRNVDGNYTTHPLGDASIGTDNTWHHLAFTLDSGTHEARCYLDGELVDSQTDVVVPSTTSETQFMIGRHYHNIALNTFPYRGQLAYVTLWNRVLSPDEVKRLMARPARKTDRGLLESWPLDQGEVGNFSLVGERAIVYNLDQHTSFTNEKFKWRTTGLSIIVR